MSKITNAEDTGDLRIEKVHFIGIGGVGMSGIAHVAHDQGIQVSGSDLKESRYTKQLREIGVDVHIGHDPANIPEGDPVVVVSTAILDNNPELIAAKERGLSIWHRAQMLAHLGIGLDTLAVAGTHGKTTTSSMLATVLDLLGDDPTFLIGGIVRSYGTNAHSGTGPHYVVEADESDKSFHYLSPKAVIITNIECDHFDHYANIEDLYENFASFIGSVPEEDGLAVVCGDDEGLVRVANSTGRRVYTYGFGEGCDIHITSYTPLGVSSEYSLVLPDGHAVSGRIKQSPGSHNVLNASAVVGLLWALGYDPDKAAEALAQFAGVRRRFDLVGKADGVTIVDDYAHHPGEISATLAAAAALGYERVHVLFQPHRYTRVKMFTEVLPEEFGAAFDDADEVTFMDVYSAGETPIPGISGKTALNLVLDHEGHPEAHYVARRIEVVPYLCSRLREGDLLITMGAGDVTAIGPELLAALQAREASGGAERA